MKKLKIIKNIRDEIKVGETIGFIFENEDLTDLLLGPNDSDDEIVFARDLGCIVDMEFGPDNALYISSISNNGLIYKIIPK